VCYVGQRNLLLLRSVERLTRSEPRVCVPLNRGGSYAGSFGEAGGSGHGQQLTSQGSAGLGYAPPQTAFNAPLVRPMEVNTVVLDHICLISLTLSSAPVQCPQGWISRTHRHPSPDAEFTRNLRPVVAMAETNLEGSDHDVMQALGPQQQMQLLGGSEAGSGFGAGSPSRNVSVPLEVLACAASDGRSNMRCWTWPHLLLVTTLATHSAAVNQTMPTWPFLQECTAPAISNRSVPPLGIITRCCAAHTEERDCAWLSARGASAVDSTLSCFACPYSVVDGAGPTTRSVWQHVAVPDIWPIRTT